MPVQHPHEQSAIVLAEQLLNLLDEGSFTATYKYAVIIGLIDLCMERTTKAGRPPQMVTTRQLAEKVLGLYWPHTLQFHEIKGILKQNTNRQAEILSRIKTYRDGLHDPTVTLFTARLTEPAKLERLVDKIERVLIKMPLPRVQVVGNQKRQFIYKIAWDRGSVEKLGKDITQYQKDGKGSFDNRIQFLSGVAENLVVLNGLLRPLLHRHWARMVARINGLQESRLENFLFGIEGRISLGAIREGLREQQNNRCFYCDKRLAAKVEVDHFIPWSRYPDNGIYNLVLADRECNQSKRDFLASDDHLRRWVGRNLPGSVPFSDLAQIASSNGWEQSQEKTSGVARSIYYHLPVSTMLWVRKKEFTAAVPDHIREVFDTKECFL